MDLQRAFLACLNVEGGHTFKESKGGMLLREGSINRTPKVKQNFPSTNQTEVKQRKKTLPKGDRRSGGS